MASPRNPSLDDAAVDGAGHATRRRFGRPIPGAILGLLTALLTGISIASVAFVIVMLRTMWFAPTPVHWGSFEWVDGGWPVLGSIAIHAGLMLPLRAPRAGLRRAWGVLAATSAVMLVTLGNFDSWTRGPSRPYGLGTYVRDTEFRDELPPYALLGIAVSLVAYWWMGRPQRPWRSLRMELARARAKPAASALKSVAAPADSRWTSRIPRTWLYAAAGFAVALALALGPPRTPVPVTLHVRVLDAAGVPAASAIVTWDDAPTGSEEARKRLLTNPREAGDHPRGQRRSGSLPNESGQFVIERVRAGGYLAVSLGDLIWIDYIEAPTEQPITVRLAPAPGR